MGNFICLAFLYPSHRKEYNLKAEDNDRENVYYNLPVKHLNLFLYITGNNIFRSMHFI